MFQQSEKISLSQRARLSLQHNGRYEQVVEVEHFLEGKHLEPIKQNSGAFSPKLMRRKESSPLYNLPVFSPRHKGGDGDDQQIISPKSSRHPVIFYPKLSDFKTMNNCKLDNLKPKIRHAVELFSNHPKEVLLFLSFSPLLPSSSLLLSTPLSPSFSFLFLFKIKKTLFSFTYPLVSSLFLTRFWEFQLINYDKMN